MFMLAYVSAIKRGLRDIYHFKPSVDGPDPKFEPGAIPNGTYPMLIEGKIDNVRIVDDRIECCNYADTE